MFNRKPWSCLIVGLLSLALVATGCDNFPPSRATDTPPPTDTPLSVVAEPTSTPTLPPSPSPTSTATPVVVVSISTPQPTAMAEPTDTPEPELESTATPAPLPRPTATPVPQPTQVLTNGTFEEGFGEDGVAIGWNKFSNGSAGFGWDDDLWDPVVWEGEHSQLLFIIDPNHNDRYIGIYQTVAVVPDQPYELTLRGLVRANTPDDEYGHRLYWGVDYEGGTDWQALKNWEELPWDQQPVTAEALAFDEYTTIITPTGQSLTLFIRGHSKWPRQSQANFNLDGLSLVGVPGNETEIEAEPDTETTMPVTGRAKINWMPIVGIAVLLFILFREGRRGVKRWREGE